MSHLGPDTVRQKFKGMVKRCADCGFDLAAGQVEVVPTAHYVMGGVVCDPETATELPGLFVAGEDAGGAHGANRLGGNGVANSTVYGGVAGDTLAAFAQEQSAPTAPDNDLIEYEIHRATHPFTQPAGDVHALRERLMDIMWDNIGVVRNADGLKKGIEQIAVLKDELLHTGLHDKDMVFNLTWHDWLNMRSLTEVSAAIAAAAWSRENSRGAHFREDFTEEGDLNTSYFTVTRQKDDNINVRKEPVQFTIVKPGESLISVSAATIQPTAEHST